ncbi:hypothetical protein COW53_02500 [bacterium CG17_big_fil_post_rev_8_21_14_2_50_64_8]|nr:MAG: hypothetical protein COW53_02500 [bacterium CG17_big_fil_post_rev_8_21_14_2_50_64_8]
MVQNKKQTNASYYEVVFRGKPKVVRAFLAGLTLGAGNNSRIFFNFADGVHHEGKAEMLADKVGIRVSDVHAIVDGGTSALLKNLARTIDRETGLAVTSHRRIRSAVMEFTFHAFARKYDDDITGLLNTLPRGLKLNGYKHNVVVDPKAKGVEAYTVAHDYEAKGSGTVSGPIDALIAFRHTLADYPLIEAEDIELKYAY